jgi:hypothetical protein
MTELQCKRGVSSLGKILKSARIFHLVPIIVILKYCSMQSLLSAVNLFLPHLELAYHSANLSIAEILGYDNRNVITAE